jgi:hypothetical protein
VNDIGSHSRKSNTISNESLETKPKHEISSFTFDCALPNFILVKSLAVLISGSLSKFVFAILEVDHHATGV